MAIKEVLLKRYEQDIKAIQQPLRAIHYIIAEGETEKKYLYRLIEKYDLRINIKLIFLVKTEEDKTNSNPQKLIDYIESNIKECNFYEETDRKIIIFDRDSYKTNKEQLKSFRDIITQMDSKNIMPIVSSPCFEFWLLLHKKDMVKFLKDNSKVCFENAKVSDRHTWMSEQVSIKMKFNPKDTIDNEIFNNLNVAIKQSKEFTSNKLELGKEIGTMMGDYINSIIKIEEK